MTSLEPTVTLVDDDASVRSSLSRLFKSAGFSVVAFASAEEFLGSGQLGLTGCLIVDVEMPGMRGPDLQDICRLQRPSLPVIVITAFNDADAERRAMSAGALAFLHKPFDAAALLRVVRNALVPGTTSA